MMVCSCFFKIGKVGSESHSLRVQKIQPQLGSDPSVPSLSKQLNTLDSGNLPCSDGDAGGAIELPARGIQESTHESCERFLVSSRPYTWTARSFRHTKPSKISEDYTWTTARSFRYKKPPKKSQANLLLSEQRREQHSKISMGP
jgi:hypothetical protein